MQHTHAPTDGSAFDAISFVLQVILEGFCIPAGSVGQRTRMERPVEQVAQLLEKKATFLRGVKSLAQSLSTLESAASLQAKSAEVFNLVSALCLHGRPVRQGCAYAQTNMCSSFAGCRSNGP
jgi:hypothetical protein